MRWKDEPNGEFSVNMAYLLQLVNTEMAGTSMVDNRWWLKHIWNVDIQPKAKVFMWRLFNSFIPTAVNLKEHHVPIEGICEFYKDKWGRTQHALIYCPKVRTIWKGSRFWQTLKGEENTEINHMAEKIHRVWGQRGYELWSTMIWQVWGYICRILHEAEVNTISPTEAGCKALREVYSSAIKLNRIHKPLGVNCGERKWKRQEHGRYRVDVDALFNPAANEFGVGIIIRDSQGEIRAARARRTPPRSNIMIAKLHAVVDGIVFSMEQGVQPIEI